MTIIGAYPKSLTSVAAKSDDAIVMEMAIDISERLMKIIEFDQAHPTIMKMDDKGRLPSLSTVLLQEIERFNKLLDVIHNSFNDLCKAIKGLVVMSAELEGVYLSFINNTVMSSTHFMMINSLRLINLKTLQVPTIWLKKAYPSLKTLGSWVKDLILRLDFIDVSYNVLFFLSKCKKNLLKIL